MASVGGIYLDYNATAPIEPCALDAMNMAARDWANPSSVHSSGQRARSILEQARSSIADDLDVPRGSVFFTSGGTEAIDIVLRSFDPAKVLVSATEHDAVRVRAAHGTTIPVDSNGVVDLQALEELLARVEPPALCCVMHVNNETGVLHPLEDVGNLVRRAGGNLLVDAVQSAGKLALPRADYLSVSAHKLGGPPGVGALIVHEPARVARVGGAQEHGLRGGTENLPGIAGFAAAVEMRLSSTSWLLHAGRLRTSLEERLLHSGLGAEVMGKAVPRIDSTSCIRLPLVRAATQLMMLDLAGFRVSAGAACSSGKVGPSHVLKAMGLSDTEAGEAIRVSLGWRTTEREVDAFAEAWLAMAGHLRAMAA